MSRISYSDDLKRVQLLSESLIHRWITYIVPTLANADLEVASSSPSWVEPMELTDMLEDMSIAVKKRKRRGGGDDHVQSSGKRQRRPFPFDRREYCEEIRRMLMDLADLKSIYYRFGGSRCQSMAIQASFVRYLGVVNMMKQHNIMEELPPWCNQWLDTHRRSRSNKRRASESATFHRPPRKR